MLKQAIAEAIACLFEQPFPDSDSCFSDGLSEFKTTASILGSGRFESDRLPYRFYSDRTQSLFFRFFPVGFITHAFGNFDIGTSGSSDFAIDFVCNIGIFLQPNAYIIFALTDFRTVVAVPCA